MACESVRDVIAEDDEVCCIIECIWSTSNSATAASVGIGWGWLGLGLVMHITVRVRANTGRNTARCTFYSHTRAKWLACLQITFSVCVLEYCLKL